MDKFKDVRLFGSYAATKNERVKKELLSIYKDIETEISQYAKFNSTGIKFYDIFLASALAKSYEFNRLVNSIENDEMSLFLTPNLRGITEDIITLKFLKDFIHSEIEELLKQLTLSQQVKILKEQEEFFKEYKPEQIIYDVDDKESKIQNCNRELRRIFSLHGYTNQNGLPKIIDMADKVGLRKLYDFMYRASSEFVHFSPHVLMRMGWSKEEAPTEFSCTTKYFSKYHSKFNSFYGSYLLVTFIKIFQTDFNFNEQIKEAFVKIESIIMEQFEFPEIITLEEMNIENVSGIRLINQIRAIKRNIQKREKESSC